MKRFLYSLVFVAFSFNAFSNPHDGKFYRGADAVVASRDLPSFYLPSQRLSLLQALHNYRFSGNRGNWNPEIPVHVQSIDGEMNPQTYVDSLIQLLFPSPDDVNLTPNQAISDPFSRLTIDDLVKLISLSRNPEIWGEDVRRAVFPDFKFRPVITNNYFAFLKYEFSRQIKDILEGVGDTILDANKISKDSPTRYSEYMESVYPHLFGEGPLKKGDIEEASAGMHYAQLKNQEHLSPKQIAERDELKAMLGEKAEQYVFFENNREDFLTHRFVDTFLKALRETDTLIENPVEKALLGYMWLKFRTPEEHAEFYEKMGVPGLRSIFEDSLYSREDYFRLKTGHDLSPEELAPVKFGYDLFENPYPPVIPYSKATVSIKDQPKTFSDCVESSLLSLLVNKAHHLKDGVYQIDPAVFPAGSALFNFFSEFNAIPKFHSPEAHNKFAQILVGLRGVHYNHESEGYEVMPGLLNSLHVFGRLIPELSKSLLSLQKTSKHKAIETGLNQLCAWLFGEGWSWEAPGIKNFASEVNGDDIFEDILFKHNGKTIYEWSHQKMHATIKRQHTPPAVFSEELLLSMREDPLKRNFIGLEDAPDGELMVSDFTSPHARALAIRRIFDTPDLSHFKPLGYSLLSAQREDEPNNSPEEDTTPFILHHFLCSRINDFLSHEEYGEILRHGLWDLYNPIQQKNGSVFLTRSLFNSGYGGILLEKAKDASSFSMFISTPEETDFAKRLIGQLGYIHNIYLHVESNKRIGDLGEIFTAHKARFEKCANLMLAFDDLNLSSPGSFDWLTSIKKTFNLQIRKLTYENYEFLEDFFSNLFRVAPQVNVWGPGIDENETVQKVINRFRPALAGAGTGEEHEG